MPLNWKAFIMAHNIDFSNNQANVAFLGSRNDVWHRLGQEMAPGMTIEQWAASAGLDWQAIKVPAIAALSGPAFDHIEASKRFLPVEGDCYVVRSDTGAALGHASDGYEPCQPSEVLDWFQRYVSVDDRFQLDTAGSLKGGKIIWAMARFNGTMDIVGDKHVARLLMSTTFDCTGSTINKATMVRVVCNNTLDAAVADGGKSIVRTRHNTAFNADRVHKELSRIAAGYSAYKAMAEAMVARDLTVSETSNFFKACLDIPFDAKESDISGRKRNQFQALGNAYRTTCLEGTEPGTAWAAINAITRYVDHDRSTRGGDSTDEAKALSANFGSGASLKAKAVGLLLPNFKVPELVAA